MQATPKLNKNSVKIASRMNKTASARDLETKKKVQSKLNIVQPKSRNIATPTLKHYQSQ
jgi:hypothetical protein